MKAVLGLKMDPWHDTGAALLVERNGKLSVVAISEERLSRQKHSRAFPQKAIDYCLAEAGCKISELSLVVADYIFTPGISDLHPDHEKRSPVPEKQAFFRQLEEDHVPVVFPEHHLCHAASAYFSTRWRDAVGLVIDGFGSNYETQSIFACKGTSLTKLATSRTPGIGWMYMIATESFLGFDHLQEGKTMGLAGWAPDAGEYAAMFEPAASGPENPLETPYPQFLKMSPRGGWQRNFPENILRRAKDQDPTAAPFAQYAFAAQASLERSVMKLAHYARTIGNSRRLCYSGGVGLNIPANRLLLDSGLFKDIFIQPAASDSGVPLGAALLGYYTMLGGKVRWQMEHAFLARDYSQEEAARALATCGAHKTPYTARTLAKILDNDYLIAWFDGASEHGPRALGHRSILCCPRHPRMKAYLNAEVKHREMFRPFAPIVPVEDQSRYFDLAVSSPYMLINARVRGSFAEAMPAVVHADGTARVQTIERCQLPRLHALLREMKRQNGLPVLLNTSLNLAGEPIVETPADTLDLFLRSRLDALVMGGQIASKVPLQQLLEKKNPGLHVEVGETAGVVSTLAALR